MTDQHPVRRFLGITVLGDFILSEGVEAVLENLHRIGATAVACNPTVTAAAEDGQGSFQPPSDAGSSPRVFDRPLFGRTSLWVRGGVSYHPHAELYNDSPYPHRKPNDLTEQHGEIIGRFIDAAVESGLKVYFQVGAVQPSGLRDEDRPRLPNGNLPENRMADTGSLASEAIRDYNRAYVRDLFRTYPNVTGFRPDWPEYPCYTFGELFQDFSPHVEHWATSHGFDFISIKQQVNDFYNYLLGRLTNDALRDFASVDRGKFSILSLFNRFPGVTDWLRMKAALSNDILQHWREIITEAAGPDKELAANAFMPGYSLLTGFDFRGAAEICDSISPKLYTMHWSLMVKFWGDEILASNPGLDEATLVKALVNLMDIADAGGGTKIADYGYPKPDEPHPIPNQPQLRKIDQAQWATGGKADLYPLVHGYGPPDDFSRRLQLVADSDADGISDFAEIYVGWTVGVLGAPLVSVFSDPRVPDGDGDGLEDLEEKDLSLLFDVTSKKLKRCANGDDKGLACSKNASCRPVAVSPEVVCDDDDDCSNQAFCLNLRCVDPINCLVDASGPSIEDVFGPGSEGSILSTNPRLADTDQDGISDMEEITANMKKSISCLNPETLNSVKL
ncbi:MAG: hypothetical protein IID46_02770 [Planctomycetes bacterium]|nr:hypothetical protein [Planctomycetota bacterium]